LWINGFDFLSVTIVLGSFAIDTAAAILIALDVDWRVSNLKTEDTALLPLPREKNVGGKCSKKTVESTDAHTKFSVALVRTTWLNLNFEHQN